MDKKFTIGLIYGRNKNWIAGSYYIENLVFALKEQQKFIKPSIKIYTESEDDFNYITQLTSYPDISLVLLRDNQNFIDKIINKVSYILDKKHLIVKDIDPEVDILFPASNIFYFSKINSKIFWIPDLQEKYFPHLFPREELEKRNRIYIQYSKKEAPIVFSSKSALSDFDKFYQKHKCKTYILPFAVTLPSLEGINEEFLKTKHNIQSPYFICSNQFWAHKNHNLILNAIANLKKRNIEINIVFTGLMNDSRNPTYINQIKKMVSDNRLENNVRFLGFVDRTEQLVLMKNSIALIQPSKFEGWSTVVEDAKALNHPIFLSEIDVHKEQLPDYPYFFHPEDCESLVNLIKLGLNEQLLLPDLNYNNKRYMFGENFMNIIYDCA